MKYVGLGSVFCLAVGIASITYGVNFVRDRIEFARHALSADGVITDSYDENDDRSDTASRVPVIAFTTNKGQVIQTSGESFSSLPNWSLGGHVRVLYLEADPDRAQVDTFTENWTPALLTGGIGLLFSLFGFGSVIAELYRQSLHHWLKRHGTLIKAQVAGIQQHQFSGTNYWQVQCRWQNPTTAATHEFVSDPIEFDPTSFAQDALDVRLDMGHPRRYEVDVEPVILAHRAATPQVIRGFDFKSNLSLGLPVVVAAVAFFVLAVSMWYARHSSSSSASRADGTVVRVVHDRSTFDPIVEFSTADGERVQFRGAGAKPAPYSKGDHVTVLFDQSNPKDARINSFREQWGAPVAFAVFGGILFLIGLSVFRTTKKVSTESLQPARQTSEQDKKAIARAIERHMRRDRGPQRASSSDDSR